MAQNEGQIGHRIVQARLSAGLTQAALSEKTGYAIRTITAWETNKRHPRITNLIRVAEATKRDVSWFYVETKATPARKQAA